MFRRLLLAVVALAASQLSHATDVDDYQNHWIHKALSYQRQLDQTAPLAQATFLATHNSYNSSRYSTAGSYWDPNQSRSIHEQLRMDIRALEFDVHSYFSMQGWPWQWRNELLLCHGQDSHVGCSTFDRKFQDGLNEIRSWLSASENRNELLLLYIEDHINGGDYGKAIGMLQNTLGQWIYRPSGGGCRGIPMQLSKADILASGKRVIVMSDGCENSDWATWVHGGVGNSLSGYPTGSIAELGGYPHCSAQRFSREFYNNHLVRFQEDLTTLTDIFGNPGQPVTPATLRTLLQCGVNIPGMDKLTPFDGRLEAAVWSWNGGEPNNWNNTEHCAEHLGTGRLNDVDCNRSYPFACRDASNNWYITWSTGVWTQGEQACALETGGVYQFATPFSSYDNEQLKGAKVLRGVGTVWLKYNDRGQEGVWQP